MLFEDDPGDALYVVATGQVKVVLIGEDGREVILSVLGEGDFFGEMSLIDEEPRSAHVIAMEDSNLLVIRREDFQSILQQSPGIAMGLLRELSRRLRRVGGGGGRPGGAHGEGRPGRARPLPSPPAAGGPRTRPPAARHPTPTTTGGPPA